MTPRVPASIPSYSFWKPGSPWVSSYEGMVRSLSLRRKTNKAIELKWAKNNGYAKKPSSLWAGAHTLGRDHTYWCLCLLTTHVRMVARSWSCMGAEPTAMLKTMLSTGSKVANSSLVGAAPAIKYHWPRWGSGNWRDNEGRRWVSLQNPTSPSVRMTILRDEGVGFLFPAKDWIHDKGSLTFPLCSSSVNPTLQFYMSSYRWP